MADFLRPFVVLVSMVFMVVLQVVLTRYIPYLRMLDLPLLSVLYLTIARENLLWTIVSGSAIGFLQDSLSLSVLGMNGFTKISICSLAYLANSILAFDRVPTRFGLLFVSSILGSLLFLMLKILFLNRSEVIEGRALLVSGVLNACAGLVIFYLFDKIIKPPGE